MGRVKHPSEVVKEGDEIDVKVLRVDKEKGKISWDASRSADPLEHRRGEVPVGAVVDGVVTRTAPFGPSCSSSPESRDSCTYRRSPCSI